MRTPGARAGDGLAPLIRHEAVSRTATGRPGERSESSRKTGAGLRGGEAGGRPSRPQVTEARQVGGAGDRLRDDRQPERITAPGHGAGGGGAAGQADGRAERDQHDQDAERVMAAAALTRVSSRHSKPATSR